MKAGSLTLFRIFGIRVQAHWTLLLLAILISWSLAVGWFPQVLENESRTMLIGLGAVGAIGLFASILLHELGHAVVARRFDMPIDKITLFLFGGIAHMEDEPPTPKAEFQMAIAGPLVSILLAGIFFVALFWIEAFSGPAWAQALVAYLASINLTVAIFNLLPGFPLDGGRILRSAIWAAKDDIRFATQVSSVIGQVFGIALIMLGLLAIFGAGHLSGIWTILIGMLVIRFARQAYVSMLVKRALKGSRVSHFMDPEPVMVSPETSIASLMRTPPRQVDQLVYPVAREDRSLLGCVDLRNTQELPPAEWESHSIGEFAKPLPDEMQISPDTDAEQALVKMNSSGSTELMVVKDNRLLGVLSIHSLIRQVQMLLSPSPRVPQGI